MVWEDALMDALGRGVHIAGPLTKGMSWSTDYPPPLPSAHRAGQGTALHTHTRKNLAPVKTCSTIGG